MQFDLERKNLMLAEQSSMDGLTRVKNHRALMMYLEDEMKRTMESKAPLSIAIIDIAAVMQKIIREGDLLGRYGGEEFMVIFKETDLEYARTVSERIRKSVADHLFGEGVRITVSAGITQYTGTTISEFIHSADMNLYAAKKNGKNQVV